MKTKALPIAQKRPCEKTHSLTVARKIVYRRRQEQNVTLIKLSYVALSCIRWARFKEHIFRQLALKYAWRVIELLRII